MRKMFFKTNYQTTQQRKVSHKTGLYAEHIACAILRLKGYGIVERRYKNPVAEIDIIAKKGNTVVICEVKYRKSATDVLWALSPDQQQGLCNSTGFIMAKYPNTNIRFDYICFWQWGFKHIKNAWGCDV